MKIRTTTLWGVICPKCGKKSLMMVIGKRKPFFRAYCIYCEKEIFIWNPLGVK